MYWEWLKYREHEIYPQGHTQVYERRKKPRRTGKYRLFSK